MRSGPAITASGFLSADFVSLDKRRIIGYHYHLRAGVQASRDIVSQCSCPLQTTSANPLWECHSMLSLLCRAGSQPGATLALPIIVLKLGATDFGLAQTLLLNVCDAPKAHYAWVAADAECVPSGHRRPHTSGVCASPGAMIIDGTKRECL
jgi:hypothetical protein